MAEAVEQNMSGNNFPKFNWVFGTCVYTSLILLDLIKFCPTFIGEACFMENVR